MRKETWLTQLEDPSRVNCFYKTCHI